MKIISAFGLILILLLSACAVPPQQGPGEVITPEPSVQEPQVEETPEQVEEVQVEEPTTDEIRILGKAGFEPKELAVSTNSTITFFNDDERNVVLSIFKDEKFYQNSGLIKAGERFELTLDEEGSYEYWATAYGVNDKITVE